MFITKKRKIPYNRECINCKAKAKFAIDHYLKDFDDDLRLMETEYLCEECYVEKAI